MSARPAVWILANTTWYVFNFRSNLIRALRDDGYEVVVCSPRDDYVERVEALGARHLPLQMRNSGVGPLPELASLARLVAAVRRYRPAMLLSFTPKVNIYSGLAARVARVPIIMNVSGLGRAFTTGTVLRRISESLYRRATRHAQWVLFQNEDDRELFITRRLVDAARTERIPGSGIDLERFRLLAPRSAQPVHFLLAARMLGDKGVNEFVAAAAALAEHYPLVRFSLLGFVGVDNPSAIPAERIAEWVDAGIVTYLGTTDRIETVFAQTDCVVLPSYREGLPRTLLEAAASGLPVIATDATGCRDALDDGITGLLCQPRDVPTLVDAMRRIIEMSPAERRRMGLAGRKKVEREFDERIVIGRYRALVGEFARVALPGSPRSAPAVATGLATDANPSRAASSSDSRSQE